MIMPYVSLHVEATQAASAQRERVHCVVLSHVLSTVQKLVTDWRE